MGLNQLIVTRRKKKAQSLIRSYNNNSDFTYESNPTDKEQVKTKLQKVFNDCKYIFSSDKTLSQNINEILGNTNTNTDNPNNVDRNDMAWKK